MKKFAILLLTAVVFSSPISAQDQLATESKPEAEAVRDAKRRLEAARKSAAKLEERPYTYSGFFVELSKAQNKRKFLSLRQPRDPKQDVKNLYLDERTARPKGFVLFAIDF